MTQKLVKIVGSYSIDAFVMLKGITNDNISSSNCLNFENGPSVTVELPYFFRKWFIVSDFKIIVHYLRAAVRLPLKEEDCAHQSWWIHTI